MRASDERGLSLLEVVIVASLLVPLVGGSATLLLSVSDAQAVGTAGATLERNATAAADRIAKELALGAGNTFYPTPASPYSCDTIQFEAPNEDSASTEWGVLRGVSMIPSPGDPEDGVDNDGDGLVDECLVVLDRGPDSAHLTRTVLARDVRRYLEGEVPNGQDDNGNGLIDESGLCLSRDGELWTLRLTLERRGPDGKVVTRTVTTAASPRNTK